MHRDSHGRVAELETVLIMGVLEYRGGDPAAAITRLRSALATAIELDLPGAEMNAHYGLGQSLLGAGEPAQALLHYAAAARIARRTGAVTTLADTDAGRARCLRRLGRDGEAEARWRSALAVYRELGLSEHDRL